MIYHNWNRECHLGNVDVDTDTFRAILVTDSYTPNADHTVKTDLGANELSTANGYTANGVEVTVTVTDDDANDRVVFDCSDPLWDSITGAVGPFRYLIIFDDTHASDALVACLDYGSNQTAQSGANISFTIDSDGLWAINNPA